MSTTRFDLEKILDRVTKLLAKADSTEFPEEAKLFRAKAEEYMREYRIAEEDLISVDQVSISPEWMEMEVCGYHNAFRRDYVTLLHYVADHCGLEFAWYAYGKNGVSTAHMVGYAGDLRLAAFLFNAARLVFKERLEPDVNRDLSDEENIYRLRQSGIERQRVARMLWGDEIGSKASAHAKVGKIYKDECRKRGEDVALDGRGISLGDFREAYASNFTWEFGSRLRQARDAADSTGGALQLHGRKERVQEAFWGRFPQYRPEPQTGVEKAEKAPAQTSKPRKETKAERERYYRKYHSAAARAGEAAGRAAAAEVEIDRVPRAKRVEA